VVETRKLTPSERQVHLLNVEQKATETVDSLRSKDSEKAAQDKKAQTWAEKALGNAGQIDPAEIDHSDKTEEEMEAQEAKAAEGAAK